MQCKRYTFRTEYPIRPAFAFTMKLGRKPTTFSGGRNSPQSLSRCLSYKNESGLLPRRDTASIGVKWYGGIPIRTLSKEDVMAEVGAIKWF